MKLFKKPIFVSVSPNAQADDIWLALGLMFCPWKWKRGRCVEKLEKMLGEYLGDTLNSTPPQSSPQLRGGGAVITFESGRTALCAILLALGIGEGDEVLIQGFTCTAAVNPILWVGAKPVYIDVDEGAYNLSPEDLEKKISEKSKVIIIQHTFGFPARVDEIMEIAKEHNLIVLEDCAHSLGAEYHGKKIGTLGEASFFSFGRSKIISSVFGGAVFARNPELAIKIRRIHDEWKYPSSAWTAQQLFHPVYMTIAKLLYNFFSIGKILIVLGKKLGLISIMVYPNEKQGGRPFFSQARMPDALACLAVNQMKKLMEFNEHRRELAEFYNNQLAYLQTKGQIRIHSNPLLQKEGMKAVFLNYPIQVEDFAIRQKCIREARKQGIYLESWPAYDKKVIGPDNTNQEKLFYKSGACPNAEKAAETSINLSTGPNTSERDARRVAEFFKKQCE